MFIGILIGVLLSGILFAFDFFDPHDNEHNNNLLNELGNSIRFQLMNEEVLEDEASIETIKLLFDGNEHNIFEMDSDSRLYKNIMIRTYPRTFENYINDYRIHSQKIYLNILYDSEDNCFEILVRSEKDNDLIQCESYIIENDISEYLK